MTYCYIYVTYCLFLIEVKFTLPKLTIESIQFNGTQYTLLCNPQLHQGRNHFPHFKTKPQAPPHSLETSHIFSVFTDLPILSVSYSILFLNENN